MTKRKAIKQKVLTDAEARQDAIDSWYNEGYFRAQSALLPKPTRSYVIGEEVKLGGLKNVIIQQSLEDGMAYLVHYLRVERDGNIEAYGVWYWFDMDKKVDLSQVPRLFKDYRHFPAITTDLSSLIHLIQHGGLVCDPEYQREYVWTDENKDALLDSMFERLDIGAFLIIRHQGYHHEKSDELKVYKTLSGETVSILRREDYTNEIIDGQQRLMTIHDFVMDRRPYRGVYFSQMNGRDQAEFMCLSVQYRQINEDQVTKKDVLRMFLQSNRGVPQSLEHIAKIQAMYDSCVD